jgi:hypothetical protein
LYVDAAELGARDCARGTGLKAAGDFAVLADIGGELPRELAVGVAAEAGSGFLLDELDVPPGGVADRAGVVVGEAGPVHAIGFNAVPFLAGDLAGFAADAESGVGEEGGGRVVVLFSWAARTRKNG